MAVHTTYKDLLWKAQKQENGAKYKAAMKLIKAEMGIDDDQKGPQRGRKRKKPDTPKPVYAKQTVNEEESEWEDDEDE